MRPIGKAWSQLEGAPLRFIINGLFATGIQYATLSSLIEIGGIGSVGVASGLASLVGTGASYLGSRFYVFGTSLPTTRTLPRFLVVYAAAAGLHAILLSVWSDLWQFSYSWGFVLATGVVTLLTFLGNQRFVFRGPA